MCVCVCVMICCDVPECVGLGMTTADELLADLVHALDGYRSVQAAHSARAQSAERERALIAAQDQEYKEALAADQRRVEAAKKAEAQAKERKLKEQSEREEAAKRAAEEERIRKQREEKIEALKRVRVRCCVRTGSAAL